MSHVTTLEHRGHTIIRTLFPRGTDLFGIREILGDAGFVYAQIAHGQVLALMHRNARLFDDQAEALEWLASEAEELT